MMNRASWSMEVDGLGSPQGRSSRGSEVDEEELKWAAVEKLPTYDRLRMSIIQSSVVGGGEKQKASKGKVVDVMKLGFNEKREFIDRVFKVAEEDNQKFLEKFRNRIDK